MRLRLRKTPPQYSNFIEEGYLSELTRAFPRGGELGRRGGPCHPCGGEHGADYQARRPATGKREKPVIPAQLLRAGARSGTAVNTPSSSCPRGVRTVLVGKGTTMAGPSHWAQGNGWSVHPMSIARYSFRFTSCRIFYYAFGSRPGYSNQPPRILRGRPLNDQQGMGMRPGCWPGRMTRHPPR